MMTGNTAAEVAAVAAIRNAQQQYQHHYYHLYPTPTGTPVTSSTPSSLSQPNPGEKIVSVSRVYAQVNPNKPREYWDWENASATWG